MSTCSLREENPFFKGLSIYTDIRKLQDQAKTSYTLSARKLRLGYERQFSKSTPGACFGVVGEEFIAYACNITFGLNKNEIQQRCSTAMVFYGQDTGCKLQENHDELGVLLPLKEFEHNILHHLEQVDGIVLRCREEMIHQAGKDSLPL